MLNIQEVGIALAFLDKVTTTGRNQAKNLTVICDKLEEYQNRLVQAELAAQFTPPPANDDEDAKPDA